MGKFSSLLEQDLKKVEPKKATATVEVINNNQIHDVTTSQSDVTTSRSIDVDALSAIINDISKIDVTVNNTPVRLSQRERDDIEEFILNTLRKRGLKGDGVSMSKLMRYSLRYMLRLHEKELIKALEQSLKKENTLSY